MFLYFNMIYEKAVQILRRTAFMCILTAHDTARAADKQM